MSARDLVVIGGSAGSTEVAKEVVQSFPADLPAAVFIVIHSLPRARNLMADVFSRIGRLPAVEPEEGDRLLPGRIYVPPPDRHLVIASGHLHVSRGPREGLHRPSINVTFRSAAAEYGARVIGVLLSGMLDDGAGGLWDIAKHGGTTIVQDPDEAEYPSMPISALSDVPIDFRAQSNKIGPLINRLVLGTEVMDPKVTYSPEEEEKFSGFTCPECHGPLYSKNNGPPEFRCRVGHAFSLQNLIAEHTSVEERKLYEALVALEEGADLAERARHRGNGDSGALAREAGQLRQHAAAIRKLIEDRRITPLN